MWWEQEGTDLAGARVVVVAAEEEGGEGERRDIGRGGEVAEE